MAIAGRVAIVPKGDWSADATYKRLDAVTYNNTLYFAKKDVPAGTVTSNTEYWSKSIVGGAGGVATADEAGVVKPADGLTIAEDGTLKVNIDGTTLTMDQVNNVIKLADTLKDAINGAFPAANVANNQITTVEGFALDARQANPNIDGSLAKQISDLNGSLNRYPSKLSQCYATDNESHTFPIDALSLFFITYGNNDQADVYLCRCVSVNAHALVPLHTSSVIAQTYEIKLDVATRSVTITSKRSWVQVDVINI